MWSTPAAGSAIRMVASAMSKAAEHLGTEVGRLLAQMRAV